MDTRSSSVASVIPTASPHSLPSEQKEHVNYTPLVIISYNWAWDFVCFLFLSPFLPSSLFHSLPPSPPHGRNWLCRPGWRRCHLPPDEESLRGTRFQVSPQITMKTLPLSQARYRLQPPPVPPLLPGGTSQTRVSQKRQGRGSSTWRDSQGEGEALRTLTNMHKALGAWHKN